MTYSSSLQDQSSQSSLRWVRSHKNCWVGGVAGGLAQQFDIEPWMMRALWVLSALLTCGLTVLVYFMCLISFPLDNKLEKANSKIIFGVCGKISNRIDTEVGLIRLLALTLLFISGGAALIGYIVLYFVLSEDQTRKGNRS